MKNVNNVTNDVKENGEGTFKPIPFLNKLFKWKKPVCTLKIGENVCEYKSWNLIGNSYDNFSRADTIIFHTDIPEKQIAKLIAIPFSSLRELYFEKGVKTVTNIFDIAQCNNLEFIHMAESVEEILPDAFKSLTKLKKVCFEAIPLKVGSPIFLGSSVEEIEIIRTQDDMQQSNILPLILKHCSNLKKIVIDGEAQPFYSITSKNHRYIYWNKQELEKRHRKPWMPFKYEIYNSDGTITDILLDPDSSSQVANVDFHKIPDNFVVVCLSPNSSQEKLRNFDEATDGRAS